jgi:hypothetical protein
MPDTYSGQVEQMLTRICAEFLEMPGLRLTSRQAERLWGLDEETCAHLLDALLEAGFLQRTRNETYTRLTDGPPGCSLPEIVHGALVARRPRNSTDRRRFPRAGN